MEQKFSTVEAYIASFPEDVRQRLYQIRKIIMEQAPEAVESIAYGMPAYKLHGKPLVYFAAFARHIGFYATPTGHEAFAKELSAYKQGKGSVQFPLGKPVPYDLIARILKFRVAENEQSKKKRS